MDFFSNGQTNRRIQCLTHSPGLDKYTRIIQESDCSMIVTSIFYNETRPSYANTCNGGGERHNTLDRRTNRLIDKRTDSFNAHLGNWMRHHFER